MKASLTGVAAGMVAALWLAGAASAAVTAPYTNDFSTSVDDLTLTPSGVWTYEQAEGVLTAKTGTTPGLTSRMNSGLFEVEGLAGAVGMRQDFVLSTDFVIKDFGFSSNTSLGLAAFANTGDVSNDDLTTHRYLLAYVQPRYSSGARVRLIRRVGSSESAIATTAYLGQGEKLAKDVMHTLTMRGTWTIDGLLLSVELVDGAAADPLLNTAVAEALLPYSDFEAGMLDGNFFGFRGKEGGSGTLEIDYRNISLTIVPEPATMALLGLGVAAACVRRRRQVA